MYTLLKHSLPLYFKQHKVCAGYASGYMGGVDSKLNVFQNAYDQKNFVHRMYLCLKLYQFDHFVEEKPTYALRILT